MYYPRVLTTTRNSTSGAEEYFYFLPGQAPFRRQPWEPCVHTPAPPSLPSKLLVPITGEKEGGR